MTISDKIELLRKSQGISLTYLNNAIGAYRGKLTEVRNGKASLSTSEIAILAQALSTSTDYLLGKTDDPTPVGQKESPPQSGELNAKDARLIEWFRSLPPEKQKAILISQDAPKELID